MKIKSLLNTIILCGVLVSFDAMANTVCTRTGAITECGAGVLDHLDVAGKATLNGTIITGSTHIAGILRAHNSIFNSLHIAGKGELIDSTINGITTISGLLESCGNRFTQKLVISSDITHLENTQTNNIEINSGRETQVVYISNKSQINGDISFTTQHGLVIIDPSSKISGHVIGGEVTQKEFQQSCGDNDNF